MQVKYSEFLEKALKQSKLDDLRHQQEIFARFHKPWDHQYVHYIPSSSELTCALEGAIKHKKSRGELTMTLEELLEKSVKADKQSEEDMKLNFRGFYEWGGYRERPYVSMKTQWIISIIKELASDDTPA